MKWVGKQSLFKVEGSSSQLVKWQWIVINKMKCHYTEFHVTKISSKARNLKWCGKSTKNLSPFLSDLVNRSWLCKDSENNLSFMTVQISSATITNPEGFAEDENICHNMVESAMRFPSQHLHLPSNNGSTRTMCEICSKLTIKHWNNFSQWSRSGIFVANFWTNFTHIDGVSSVGFEQVNVGWVLDKILYNLIIWKE